jgi:hypothetical protein
MESELKLLLHSSRVQRKILQVLHKPVSCISQGAIRNQSNIPITDKQQGDITTTNNVDQVQENSQ